MLNLKLTLNLRNSYLIILLMLGITSLDAQCILNVSDLNNPSSCYATDGSFQVTSVNGGCNRLISVYKNSVLLAQGSGTINISGQGAGILKLCLQLHVDVLVHHPKLLPFLQVVPHH
jgi:hypothetical protein